MKYASASLISFLNGLGPTSQPLIADLLTVRLLDGTIKRLTSAAVNIKSTSLEAATLNVTPPVLDATVYTFVGGGVTFVRDRVSTKIGLEAADTRIILAIPAGTTLEGSLTWQQAVELGLFDGAAITLERAYMPTWNDTSAGTVILFKGFPGEVKSSRSTVDMTVKAGIAILGNPMPRRTWQPGCTHVLYDTGCALVKASFTVTGTASTGSTASAIKTSRTEADHYFEAGQIKFTSGANSGLARDVVAFAHTNGLVSVIPPFPAAPANGDAFSMYPGCDKTLQTCINKFNNVAHFAGMPFIPTQEAVL